MLSLKRHLDKLAGEGHPFLVGPDLKEGSAFPIKKLLEGVPGDSSESKIPEDSIKRFYFIRFNKN